MPDLVIEQAAANVPVNDQQAAAAAAAAAAVLAPPPPQAGKISFKIKCIFDQSWLINFFALGARVPPTQ